MGPDVESIDQEQPYLQHQKVIGDVIHFISRRQHLDTEAGEDFASYVHVKLLENDSAILRKYRGESGIKSFLFTVIQHLFQDYRHHKWGKWRTSAMARRLGSTAELLETLLVRDGHRFDQAAEIIRTNHRIQISLEELRRLASLLPVREKPRRVDDSHLETRPTGDSADQSLRYREWFLLAQETSGVLARALKTLDSEDRVILKMSFWDGLPVSGIARLLNLKQKPLYRRIDKLLRQLRGSLQSEGVGPEVIERLASHPFSPSDTDSNGENDQRRPSPPM